MDLSLRFTFLGTQSQLGGFDFTAKLQVSWPGQLQQLFKDVYF
jgi:hypothetical protein